LPERNRLTRFSVSIPERLLGELDRMVVRRGYKSRSQAIAEMARSHLVDLHAELGRKKRMAGTITLVYDYRKRNLQRMLADIQHKYYELVISSLQVHLENYNYLEVLLVQGPGADLKRVADELITCKGVKQGNLNLTAALLPPLL
jgi:CopG family nickel-responsive transcriptional regulator